MKKEFFVAVVGGCAVLAVGIIYNKLTAPSPKVIYWFEKYYEDEPKSACVWVRNDGDQEADDVRCTIEMHEISEVDVGPAGIALPPQIGEYQTTVPIPHLNAGQEISISFKSPRLSKAYDPPTIVVYKGGQGRFDPDAKPLPFDPYRK